MLIRPAGTTETTAIPKTSQESLREIKAEEGERRRKVRAISGERKRESERERERCGLVEYDG